LEVLKTPKKRGVIIQLARKYGVSRSAISKIYNGDKWKHLNAKINTPEAT